MKKILVGIDSSQASINALKFAGKMAKLTGAELLGIHVINVPSYREYYGDLKNKLAAEANDILNKAKALMEKEGISMDIQVDSGSPDIVIAEIAKKDKDISMIVLGASGRGRGARVFVGSKTQAVINQVGAGLPCAVVIVPGKSQEFLERL